MTNDNLILTIAGFLAFTFSIVVLVLLWLIPGLGPLAKVRPESDGLRVVQTRFYNPRGLVATVPGAGNIQGEDGPYRKCTVWSDGQWTWQADPRWVGATWGKPGGRA